MLEGAAIKNLKDPGRRFLPFVFTASLFVPHHKNPPKVPATQASGLYVTCAKVKCVISECGTNKKSESLTGFKSMASQRAVRCSNH